MHGNYLLKLLELQHDEIPCKGRKISKNEKLERIGK
jgi:hypothetical protein